MAVIVIDRCLTTSATSARRERRRMATTLFVALYAACALSTLAAATPHAGAAGGGCNIANANAIVALRDYDFTGVQPTQGPICGANSCCASVEYKIRQTTRDDVETFYKDSVGQIQSLFETRARRLEDLFKDMMMKSKKELHEMFYRTYGIIYMQNAVVFTDFFNELEKYYVQGGIRLAETMDRFFTILYQRMFVVINSQYAFSDDYIACVAKDITDMKPFGDIPNKLAGMLRRAFVATRTFHRSLGKGAVVLEKMMKLNITDLCGEEVMKMQHCDVCTGNAGPGACNQFCTDTIRKCFGDLSELNEKWNIYIDSLDKVAEKLLGPFNIEVVVEPLNVKISEAIMNFQDNGNEVSQKVFLKCGHPKLKGDRTRRAAETSQSKELKRQSLQFNKSQKKKHKNPNSFDRQSVMEKRIQEVKGKIKDGKNFWENLRYAYCNNVSTAAPGESKCWNGNSLSGYVPQPSKLPKNELVYEQTYTLGVYISHLESAYMGQEIDETDDEEEEDAFMASGSGSGAGINSEDDTHVDEEDDDDVHQAPTSTSTASTTSTSSTTTTESNEVELVTEFNEETRNEDVPVVVQASSATELGKALMHYVLPIVMVWFGGAVTDLL